MADDAVDRLVAAAVRASVRAEKLPAADCVDTAIQQGPVQQAPDLQTA